MVGVVRSRPTSEVWLLSHLGSGQAGCSTSGDGELPSLSQCREGGNRLNGKTIWSRKTEGRFPEAKEIKQRVRDIISPEKVVACNGG